MTDGEVVRRLRVLVALPEEARPVSITRLEQVAGMAHGEVYEVARRGTAQPNTFRRLSRALEFVENDQIRVRRRANKPSVITIADPKPPQETVMSVRLEADGLKVRTGFHNPRALPDRLLKGYSPRHGNQERVRLFRSRAIRGG